MEDDDIYVVPCLSAQLGWLHWYFLLLCIFERKMKNKLSCEVDKKLFFDQNSALQAACDTSIARVTGCTLVNDTGRWLPC